MKASGQLYALAVLPRGNSFWYVMSTRLGGPPKTVWTLWWIGKNLSPGPGNEFYRPRNSNKMYRIKFTGTHFCHKYVIGKLFVTMAIVMSWKEYQMCDFIVKKEKIVKASGDRIQGNCRQCTTEHYVCILNYLLTYSLHGAESFLSS